MSPIGTSQQRRSIPECPLCYDKRTFHKPIGVLISPLYRHYSLNHRDVM
jgi:hypothetical protein